MTPEQLAELDRRIHRRLDKLIRNTREFIATVEWWNDNRTDCEPLDCEDQKILLQLAIQNKEARTAGRFDECERLGKEMVAVMETACAGDNP